MNKELQEALKKLIIHNINYEEEREVSLKEIEKKFEPHIGFKKEKGKFTNYIYVYSKTHGEFYPQREIICYAGAPGTGKTSFIGTLKDAMGRKAVTISCSGLKEFTNYSILGDKNKPSLAAWAIKETGCKNPIILLDELEKVEEGSAIQEDLIKLFEMYKNEKRGEKEEDKSKKLKDPYYQMDIELDHITFFATVNYPEKLSPLLKLGVNMRVLEDYTNEEKEQILKLKKEKIEKNYQGEIQSIIPDKIISELPKYIRESGIRQEERVLYKIEKKYIHDKQSGKTFSLGDPKKWLEDNVLPYQESFQPRMKHYFLFVLWGIIWILSLAVIIQKIILRKENSISQRVMDNQKAIKNKVK